MVIKKFFYNESELLEKAFSIRRKVFIEEQSVDSYEEFDEFDKMSVHYLVFQGEDALGTARWRVTDQGIKFERFAVLKEYRGKGNASEILKLMLNDCRSGRIYLHAQVGAVEFYSKHGFEVRGEKFIECNIDHFTMFYPLEYNSLGLSEAIQFVEEFHRAFGLPVGIRPKGNIDEYLRKLRYNLMKEENEEYKEAAKEGDLVEIADALGDMLYILCGTIIIHGLQDKIVDVYREIQRSNMSKLDENGKPIYREDGKVLKSRLYFKPDIKRILEN